MKNKGMTLFIAIVIMGVLLFISFAVVNITIKGTLFASSGKDSQFAFYAADSGIECAVYWDSKFDKFATSTAGTITCAGLPVSTGDVIFNGLVATSTLARIGGGTDANQTSTFGMRFNLVGSNPINSCAIVTVWKHYEGSPLVLKTRIKSRGYNTCDTSNPRRVERGVEVMY
jgi:hypothetical protein